MDKDILLGSGLPVFQNRHDNSRVFVQLSENAGCPVGCKYCYIPNVGQEARPIGQSTMAKHLDDLTTADEFTNETSSVLGAIQSHFCRRQLTRLSRCLSTSATGQTLFS